MEIDDVGEVPFPGINGSNLDTHYGIVVGIDIGPSQWFEILKVLQGTGDEVINCFYSGFSELFPYCISIDIE